jgi:hypothetical protein
MYCEFHQIQRSFGDVGWGNLHNEHVIVGAVHFFIIITNVQRVAKKMMMVADSMK